LFDQHNIDQLPAFGRLFRHKQVIKEAARLTRNHLLIAKATSVFSIAQTLTTIARATARNDSGLANKILQVAPMTARIFSIDVDGDVFLCDPASFEFDISCAKTGLYANDVAQLDR